MEQPPPPPPEQDQAKDRAAPLPPPPCINSILPELVMLNTFDHLPIWKLLELHRVCPYWHYLQLKAGSTRRTLSLHLGRGVYEYCRDGVLYPLQVGWDSLLPGYYELIYPELEEPDFHLLDYEELDEAIEELPDIAAVLPNIQELVVVTNGITSQVLDYIIPLLRQWSSSLLTLRLFCSFEEDLNYDDERHFTSSNIFDLLEVINSLEKLQSLELQFSLDFAQTANRPIEFPILSRLHKFRFYSNNDPANWIHRSLLDHASANQQLQRIELYNYIHSDASLNRFLRFSPELAARFKCLRVYYERDFISNLKLKQFAAHFNCLDSLSLDIGALSITELANCLAPLRQLTTLQLDLDFTKCPPFAQDDDKDPSMVGQLPMVKTVKLVLRTTHHENMNSIHLGLIFPGVEAILYQITLICGKCKSYGTRISERRDQKIRECQLLLFKPWKQCLELKRVFHETPGYLNALEISEIDYI